MTHTFGGPVGFTVSYSTTGSIPDAGEVATWLTARGEPFERDGETTIALTFLPVDVQVHATTLRMDIEVTPTVPLTRLVDLLFDLSVYIGGDVRLNSIAVTRPQLWMRLADEQDRLRIGQSLTRADEHGNKDEVLRGLWRVVDAIRGGRDDRWDAQHNRIVELCLVGERLSLAQARALDPTAETGDEVSVPIVGSMHTLAWRWLSEAYPGIAEPEHTLH